MSSFNVVNRDIRWGLFSINRVNEAWLHTSASEMYSECDEYNFELDLTTDQDYQIHLMCSTFARQLERHVLDGRGDEIQDLLMDLISEYAQVYMIEPVVDSDSDISDSDEDDLE